MHLKINVVFGHYVIVFRAMNRFILAVAKIQTSPPGVVVSTTESIQMKQLSYKSQKRKK